MADNIAFETFSKMKFVIATVKSARPHPNADKLVVMDVDNGERVKQIVAGLRPQHEPESLVGKCIVLVDNLEPAVLRGEQSEGMLLAAVADGKIVLIVPEEPSPAGTPVS